MVAPEAAPGQVIALAHDPGLVAALVPLLLTATPHGRFQLLTSLLLCLCAGSGAEDAGRLANSARRYLIGFYLTEVLQLLAGLADEGFIAAELHRAELSGAAGLTSLWRRIQKAQPSAEGDGTPPGPFTPLKRIEEAVQALRLALNPFLAKVHMLLSLLSKHKVPPALDLQAEEVFVGTAAEHHALADPGLGLPRVEDLLRWEGGPSDLLESEFAWAMSHFFGSQVPLRRGLQPLSQLLLVMVHDSDVKATGEAEDAPHHVWQMSADNFERLVRLNRLEVLRFPPDVHQGRRSQLCCIAYRLALPVVTGRVYQKFYTQFVHARCTLCKSSPSIPTLCLLCGTFLCCNSECCRRPQATSGEEDSMTSSGEVTTHARACGFGTCVFLQLSNSLVHVVADGFIACWGSLYLDSHGEEEYNLARPLHISEARLQQLTESLREVSFDFDSRLKWKKVIFV